MDKLRIMCLVKIVPDVKNIVYDYEKNILVRENKKSIINPDDACAVAAALHLKEEFSADVTVLSMGPESNRTYLEDLIRRGVDRAYLITDPLFRGSDTYVTSKILARSIKEKQCDLIFTGVHSWDGDTAHVPAQIAEFLDVYFMSHVIKIIEGNIKNREIILETAFEEQRTVLAVKVPAILGISSDSKYKLPFVKYENRKKDVSSMIQIETNKELNFSEEEVGLSGSKTQVIKTYPMKMKEQKKIVVKTDEVGIDCVYKFLKEKGFL